MMKLNGILRIVIIPLVIIVLLNVTLQILDFVVMPPITIIIVLLNFFTPYVFATYSGFETVKKMRSGIVEGGISGAIIVAGGYVLSIIVLVALVYTEVFSAIVSVFAPQDGPGFGFLASGLIQTQYLVFGVLLSLLIGFVFGGVGGFIAQKA